MSVESYWQCFLSGTSKTMQEDGRNSTRMILRIVQSALSEGNTSAVKYDGYSTRQSTNIGNKAMTAIFPYEATLEYSDDIVLQRSHVHKLQSAFTNLSYFEALLHAQYLGL